MDRKLQCDGLGGSEETRNCKREDNNVVRHCVCRFHFTVNTEAYYLKNI